jgi:hypothetical protein
MAERTGIEEIVGRVVSQVLDSHVPRMREELVEGVLEELPSETAKTGATSAGAAELLRAISLIHAGSTQREILRALLDGAMQYCGRAALFVIKAGAATGWQGRGFTDADAIKDFPLNVSAGLSARALQERTVVRGNASEVDSRFIEQFGAPAEQPVLVMPLLLKDKVAALVYADAGVEAGPTMDSAALELLVISTSAWLEVASLRKQAPKESASEAPVASPVRTEPPVQTVSSFVDPFAGHAPKHATAVPAADLRPALDGAQAPPSSPAEEVPVVAASASASAPAESLAGMSPEDAEVHRKAQRFAKLLVDEIKLYNQAKVAEGRKNKDLYERLKADIEKSRATFQKRYGNTVAANGEYFMNEVIRSLAEDDASIMGANFRR